MARSETGDELRRRRTRQEWNQCRKSDEGRMTGMSEGILKEEKRRKQGWMNEWMTLGLMWCESCGELINTAEQKNNNGDEKYT